MTSAWMAGLMTIRQEAEEVVKARQHTLDRPESGFGPEAWASYQKLLAAYTTACEERGQTLAERDIARLRLAEMTKGQADRPESGRGK